MSFNFNVARTEQPPPGCYYDEYGQIQYKFKWYKIPSWKPQYRGALYGTTVTVVGIYFVSKILRRPVYAMLPASVTAIGVSAGFWYFLGKFFTERQNRLRDATISHYIQLHPEDFEVTRSPGRKYREILAPWIPYRGLEKTVPLLSGRQPSFWKEPTEPPAEPDAKEE